MDFIRSIDPAGAIEIALKSLVLLIAILILTWFMRRSSAAVRHLYLSVAVILLLVLPVASLLLPSWNVELLPGNIVSSQNEVDLLSSGGESRRSEPIAEAPLTSLTADGEKAPSESIASENQLQLGWLDWIFIVWSVGAVCLILHLIGGKLYGFRAVRRSSVITDERIIGEVEEVSGHYKIDSKIPVLQSDQFRVPVVSGVINPCLVMPSSAEDWPIERLRAILHHEFAHIKRRDVLMQLLAQIVRCIYWINPLAWILERKLFIERERACDDAALHQNIKASDYAGHLMEVLEEMGNKRHHVWVMSAMADGTDFKDRILSVLNPAARRSTPKLFHSTAVVAFALILLLPLSALSPWAAANDIHGDTPGMVSSLTVDAGGNDRQRDGARSSGEELDDADLSSLIESLRSPVADMREHAAAALGKMGDVRAVPALIEVLGDRDRSVREHAAEALGKLGDNRAVVPMTEAMKKERNNDVREHMATALGKIADRAALPYLLEVLRSDPNAKVREHAASAVGCVGGEQAYRALLESYENDYSVRVKAHALYGMGLMKEKRAVDLLIRALDADEWEIRANAADALGMIGERRAVKYLKKALDDPSWQVRERAAKALKKLD